MDFEVLQRLEIPLCKGRLCEPAAPLPAWPVRANDAVAEQRLRWHVPRGTDAERVHVGREHGLDVAHRDRRHDSAAEGTGLECVAVVGVVGLVELHTAVLAGCAEELQDEADAEDGVFLRDRGRWEATILVEIEVVVEAGLGD